MYILSLPIGAASCPVVVASGFSATYCLNGKNFCQVLSGFESITWCSRGYSITNTFLLVTNHQQTCLLFFGVLRFSVTISLSFKVIESTGSVVCSSKIKLLLVMMLYCPFYFPDLQEIERAIQRPKHNVRW